MKVGVSFPTTEVGNDPFVWSSSRLPTLSFEGVSVSGT